MKSRVPLFQLHLHSLWLILHLTWLWLLLQVLQVENPSLSLQILGIYLLGCAALIKWPAYQSLVVAACSSTGLTGFLFFVHYASLEEMWFTIPLMATLSWLLYDLAKCRVQSVQSLKSAVLGFRSGEIPDEIPVYLRDEVSVLALEMNSLAAHLREKELLTQYIAPEVWQEMQKETSRSLRSAKEKWVICLSMYLPDTEAGLESTKALLTYASDCSKTHHGFLNELSRESVQILFFEESEGHEKHALMALAEFVDSDFSRQYPQAIASLRYCFVKSGIVLKSEGLRMRCSSLELKEELETLRNQRFSARALVHKSFEKKAERVFHLAPFDGDYTAVTGQKDLEYHLANLQSPRVEDKLVSIRVIETHRIQQGVAPLILLLGDVSPRVRIDAAKALSRMVNQDNEETIGKAFLESLGSEWNNDCRATLVISLGELRKKSFVTPLFHLLQDENDRVRANAIEAIGKCMERATILRYLESMLSDRNNRARANASMALWLMGMKKGFLELLKMADSPEPLLSSSGLYGIGEAFRDENLKILFRSLTSPLGFYLKERQSIFLAAATTCQKKVMSTHPLVERNAILALQKIRSTTAVPVLMQKFTATEDENVQQLILETLLSLEEFTLVSQLRRKVVQK